MTMQEDWRLTNQEAYLQGATLVLQPWEPSEPHNDHDHCAFCWEKFANYDGCLHEGYATEERYYWICESCFNDFRQRFKWSVKEHE